MIFKKYLARILYLVGLVFLQSLFNYCLAQEDLGKILPDKAVQGADASALQAEANSFNTMKKGVALSLAMCEGIKQCKPDVNRDELEKIISMLDERIGSVGQRYEQTGNKDLEGVLLTYHDAKESYSKYLDKLNIIVPEEKSSTEDLFGQGDLFGAPAASNPYSIFNDSNQEIKDDTEAPVESGKGTGGQSQNNKK